MNDFDKIYEAIKDNKIGWRQETMIGDKKYLVFIRPDLETNGTEIVFRQLLLEK